MSQRNTSSRFSDRVVGPGLIEALAWSSGCHLVQLLVFILLAAGLLWCATPVFPPTFDEVVRLIDELGWQSSFLFTGATTLAALLVIVPLVRLRVGPQLRAEFGARSLSWSQMMLVIAAVVPLAVLSNQVYLWGLGINAWLVDLVPELEVLTRWDAMRIVQEQAESTAYPVLLVALALAPAITEELVFRGLIGRGLIARWGVGGGVILTTLLFAAAHGTPAHLLATLPIGLCLHIVYRLTGTLWAPILLHAGNNALAVTLMKLQAAATSPASPPLLFAACGYLAVIACLLHEAHGAETPSPLRTSAAFPKLAGSSILTFTCVFVWSQLSPH